MTFDLDRRTAALSVGEFAGFTLGPRDAGSGGAPGIWRAQLGTHWHNELRSRAITEHASAATFEIPITGQVFHRGWTLTLTGRIDQMIRADARVCLREIKSVTRPLPADEAELRADYPEYFIQIATYAALARRGLVETGNRIPDTGNNVSADPLAPDLQLPVSNGPTLISGIPPAPVSGFAAAAELVFVETSSGLAQTIPLTPADEALFQTQLERFAEFLNLRLRARERLRQLRFRPAFAAPRPGQETTQAELTELFERRPLVLFEAPTGFGKTGVLLEFALGQLRSGHFDRALYLTSKSTGQLQVVRTLQAMTAPTPPDASPGVAFWHVRNKSEHCVNTVFHCVRDHCIYLSDAAARWPQSGLARFYLDEKHARDLDTLRAAGRDARICPYEITRTALAFNDVWIGDYNYVFAPRNRGLFFEQPGFVPARTLLLLDEAHNLPSRVADAYSHAFSAADAYAVRDELHRVRPLAHLVTTWDQWCHFLHHLRSNDGLSAMEEDDARHLLGEIAKLVRSAPFDLADLGPHAADAVWSVPSLVDELETSTLPRLWWSPRDAELNLTCLDAASAIGATLREFGGVVLASATLTPIDAFGEACGLQDTGYRKPDTGKPGNTGNRISDTGTSSVIAHPKPSTENPDESASRIQNSAPLSIRNPQSTIRNPSVLSGLRSPVSGIDRLGTLTKRDTKKLSRHLTSAAELLRVEEARDAAAPAYLRAHAPWRDAAYDLAFDARVDTTFQHRSHHYTTTAATIAALHAAQPSPNVPASPPPTSPRVPHPSPLAPSSIAVFFPSYAYADAIARELAGVAPALRVALQPKLRDLAAQSAWVDESLLLADALFLVLGSSFAESIDALGGRISHAMVVGPALPEVNAVQRARLAQLLRPEPVEGPATRTGLARDAAFRRVYQIPGMTKVNQALGRLVRAPGHRARVILHCRRFLDTSYVSLLAPEYQQGTHLHTDADLNTWLESRPGYFHQT